MQCLNKKFFKNELKHYADILGSEEAAYYVLASNNGYTLDKTPSGDPSPLYAALLESTGSEEDAVLKKASAYTPQFFKQHGNWIESAKEPSIADINGYYSAEGNELSSVLEDSGRFIEDCHALEDANILDHTLAIVAAVGHERDQYSAKYVDQWIKEHPESNEYQRKNAERIAKSKWTVERINKLMGRTQQALAERFGLVSTEKDGRIVYISRSKDTEDQLRVEFVNSITAKDYLSQDGTIKKGAFYNKKNTDAMYSLIQISLEDGDPSVFIHELAHSYIRLFWNSETVLRALRVVDADTPGRLTPKDLEEILVENVTDRVLNKKSAGFFRGIREIFKIIARKLNFKDKTEIRDLVTSYFVMNRDLSYDQAEQITYAMYQGPVYASNYNVTERDVFKTIVRGLKRKIEALEATGSTVANIARTKQNLLRAEERNPNESSDVQATVEDFLNLAIDEICEAERYLSAVIANGIDSLNIKEFMDVRNNILKYYQITLNNYIVPLTIDNRTTYLSPNTTLYSQYDQVRAILSRIQELYDNSFSKYIDKFIDDYVEANVDVGDKARFAYNTKLWLRNLIGDGKLMFGETFIGGTTSSRSPVVRMVEFMISSANTQTRIETNTLGHKLLALYNACKPAVSFSNFMKTFVEVNKKGRPTGYFIRDINYGQFYEDRDEFIHKLDEKYDVQVDVDSRGQEERTWKSDNDWKNYQDELDDWLDQHANRKYTAEYYKDRRKYMSRDTLQQLDYIQDRINTIKNKCMDPTLGIPFTFELSVEDRQELRKLEHDKDQLANPYIIIQDLRGDVVSIQIKSGDALRMANEIGAYKKATSNKLHYKVNTAKYAQVEDYIRNKYGDSSILMSRFKYDYLSTIINPQLWDIVGDTLYLNTAEAKKMLDLQYRKNAILRICYDKKGEYVLPSLSRLNEDAFLELKSIDEQMAAIKLKPGVDIVDATNKMTGQLQFNQVFMKKPVMYNQTMTYFDHLLDEARNASAHNPNAVLQFYDTYTYVNRRGEQVPLSAFFYLSPIYEYTASTNGPIKSIIDSPVGVFNEVEESSYYRNQQWDANDPTSVLPLRSKYDNSEKYNKIKLNPKQRAFYEALLLAMDDAYKKLPHYHERAKYLLPQIADKELGRLAGGWRDIAASLPFVKMGGIDDDIEINMSLTLGPDESPINLIPIRWNRLNKSIKLNTDILYTVVAFSKMASEYEQKSKIAPTIEAIIEESRKANAKSDQTRKLEDYADMQLYGNLKKPLTKDRYGDNAADVEKKVSLFLGGVLDLAHTKLMSRNYRAVLKNLIDSTMTLMAEIFGGKHFTTKDFLYSTGYAFHDIIYSIKGIGSSNTKSKLCAAMLFTGAAQTVDEIFQYQKDSKFIRCFKKFFCMGEYTLVDYLIKGIVTGMAFHHIRLVNNPLTGKDEFMTQDQVRYAYTAAGLNKEDGSDVWNNSNTTLWDVYSVDETGNFVLDPQYEDIVRPMMPHTGRRSNKIETRVAGVIRERGSVINGVLDSANKGDASRNYLGAAFLQMRGWMVTHFFDYFKNGEDFAEFVKASESSKNIKNKNDNDDYIKESEDFAYAGQYNFETGTIERGVYRGLVKAVGRWVAGVTHLNRILNTQKCTDNERYQVRRLNAVLVGMFFAVLTTVITGKKLEEDKDDKLMNFLYTVSVAAVSERATTIPLLQVLTAVDILRTPFIAYTLVLDFESILNLIADGYEASTYDPMSSGYIAEYSSNVTHGTYQNMQRWLKDALKTNAELYPYVNINNMYRSVSPQSNKASANYYRGIFPTSELAYKPKINKTKNSDEQGFLADVWDWFRNTANQ